MQVFPVKEWEEWVKISYKKSLGTHSPSCKIQYLWCSGMTALKIVVVWVCVYSGHDSLPCENSALSEINPGRWKDLSFYLGGNRESHQ